MTDSVHHPDPTLTRVVLSDDVAHTCLTHALTTEHQEIVGLLVGYRREHEVIICSSLVLSREDRQKDRVEVGYEHLASASTTAERISELDGFEQHIVGWYHSHPHITVFPSHVDVKTQANYQQLDTGFVGLIFSVFDRGHLDICAFQSKYGRSPDGAYELVAEEVPIAVSPAAEVGSILSTPSKFSSTGGLLMLQHVLLNEEKDAFLSSTHNLVQIKEPLTASGALELSRKEGVYRNSLLRLMDIQLIPVLSSIRSRYQSLALERNKLLGVHAAHIPEHTSCDQSSTSVGTGLEGILHMLAPHCGPESIAVKHAFSGVFATVTGVPVQSLSSGPHIVKVQQANNYSCCGGVAWPWLLCIGDSSECCFPLLSIVKNVGDMCDNCVVECEVAINCSDDTGVSSTILLSIVGSKNAHDQGTNAHFKHDEDNVTIAKCLRENLSQALGLDALAMLFSLSSK
mmetsp:Transcript_13655/g.20457  ORF Transcript_13655/g.20457 Transcript_13655/m.20457 type:complete len:457 (+) Transcript_13655:29-1399(+)